jgi:outer membrane lipoprotein-sorting protein
MSRLARLAFLAVLPLSFSTAARAEWGLQSLMDALSAVTRVDATFEEQKTSGLLEEQLVSTGILRYRAPDYLEKRVLEPHAEVYEVEGGGLLVDTPEKGRRDIHLDDYPFLRALVESVRATLAGDLVTLERYYCVSLEGQAEDWTLRLEPREEAAARYIAAIVIGGEDGRVLRVETLESDGDRALMTITPMRD